MGRHPRSTGRGALVAVLLRVPLLLLLCCGSGWYFNDDIPEKEAKTREALYKRIGVPEGFSRGPVDNDVDIGHTLDTTFFLECPKGVCSVNAATEVHRWMSANGAVGVSEAQVTTCFRLVLEDDLADCVPQLAWKKDGHEISVRPSGLTLGSTSADRRFTMRIAISTPD